MVMKSRDTLKIRKENFKTCVLSRQQIAWVNVNIGSNFRKNVATLMTFKMRFNHVKNRILSYKDILRQTEIDQAKSLKLTELNMFKIWRNL